jgi:hypothetical protein
VTLSRRSAPQGPRHTTAGRAVRLREIRQTSEQSPSEWIGVDQDGVKVLIRYDDGMLRIVHGNDPTVAKVLCFRPLGQRGDSFLTPAQLWLEVGGILELP